MNTNTNPNMVPTLLSYSSHRLWKGQCAWLYMMSRVVIHQQNWGAHKSKSHGISFVIWVAMLPTFHYLAGHKESQHNITEVVTTITYGLNDLAPRALYMLWALLDCCSPWWSAADISSCFFITLSRFLCINCNNNWHIVITGLHRQSFDKSLTIHHPAIQET